MPEPARTSNIGLYRSGVTSPERLRHTSVGREHLLDNAIESLRGSADRKSKKHLLFIGPRGIGKTHLLSCIEDVVRSDETLDATFVVVRFPEETNRTRSFADFLIGVCEILKQVLDDEPRWTDLFAAVQTEENDTKVVDTLVPAFREENRRSGRTFLVMLENLGEVLTRQFGKKKKQNDVAALRKFFMADNGCLLLATAPIHFDGITDVEQPFYDFFDVQILERLTFEETVEVISRNLKWEGRTDILDGLDDMRPRLKALYRMTGGNPRLTMMLYELIAHESVTGVLDQFHILLDRISPFYQGRLNDLAPSERALLECLASMRDQEKTPAAIAARMRMTQQETSSLLKRLSDDRYLRADRHPRDRRSRLYTIREGFFDIWLAMNLSRGARRHLPFLLEFFSLFYPSMAARDEKRLELRAKLLEEGSDDAERALDYLSQIGDARERATAKLDMARIFARRSVAKQTLSYVREAALLAGDDMSQLIARIVKSAPPAPDYLSEIEEMIEAWEIHRSGDLEAFAERLAEMGRGLTLQTFSETKLAFLQGTLEGVDNAEERILQRVRIAEVLKDLARWEDCEEQQRLALAEAQELAHSSLIVLASNNLAHLLERTNRLAEAEPLMRRALEIAETAYGKQHQNVATCLNNLAQVLMITNRAEEAEPLIRRALKIEAAILGEQHPNMVSSLSNLAGVLEDTNRFEEAESLMRRALEIAETICGKQHPTVANCLNNLAHLLESTSRLEEAEPLMRRALEIDEAAFGQQHPTVANCLNNLAHLLESTNRLEEAEPLMRRALEIGETAYGEQHPTVAIYLHNLAALLHDTNRIEEAEPLLRRSLEILDAFRRQTGHEHSDFRRVKANFAAISRRTRRSS